MHYYLKLKIKNSIWRQGGSRTNHRKGIPKCVERGWRGEHPLLAASHVLLVCAGPNVSRASGTICKSEIYNVKEVQEALRTQIASITANYIPPLESIRIILISARHSSQPKEMLGKESKIYPYKEQEELCLSVVLWILATSLFTYPKVKCCKNSSYSSHTQYVVEVCYYIVGVVLCYVNSRVCKYNSCKPTNGKLNQEPNCKKHRGSEPQRPSVDGSKPTENFNSCGYSNNHCSACKVCTGVYIKPYSVHVVSPYEEPLHSNCSHCINHSNVTKNRLTCKEALHMANNTKCRLNEDIHLRVSKEPEQVLIQYYVTSTCRQEEGSIKVTVCK